MGSLTKAYDFREFRHVKIKFDGQTNGSDCGLFVCTLMRLLLANISKYKALLEENNVLKYIDMSQQREIILSEIFCGKVLRQPEAFAIVTKKGQVFPDIVFKRSIDAEFVSQVSV